MAPDGATKHLKPMEVWIDFKKRRAIIIEDADCYYTLTTVNDMANVVARAIEYEGEWPVVGGIHGTTLSNAELLEIGAKVRGIYSQEKPSYMKGNLIADQLSIYNRRQIRY